MQSRAYLHAISRYSLSGAMLYYKQETFKCFINDALKYNAGSSTYIEFIITTEKLLELITSHLNLRATLFS